MARQRTYIDLSGGMNSQTSPLFIEDNECELVQNYHVDKLGALTKRNGIANLVGQIVDGKPVLGMFFFDDMQGTDKSNVLVAIDDSGSANSDIHDIETNVWAISQANDSAGALPVFTTFLDYVYRTNGNEVMGSSNDPTSSWGTTGCLADSMQPKYCAVWEDRVYAANDASNPYPSRIFWSSLGEYGSAPTWDTAANGQWADINPDDNDEITWIHPFGNRMLIFKEHGLYHWSFGQVEPDKIIDVGTPQGRTVAETQGFVFFANKHGVYTHSGQGTPKIVSRKVEDFIDAIPEDNLSDMRGITDRDHYYLYVGDVTVDSTDHSDIVLVYTLSKNSWHIETYPFAIKSMAVFKRKTLGTTEIYRDIYLGDNDGYVYRKGTGNSDYLGTTEKPISGRIVTKEYTMDGFPGKRKLEKLTVFANKAVGAKVNYRIDRGRWKDWKDLKERFTEGNLPGAGRTIQLSITDSSTSKSRIEGFSIMSENKGEK